MADALRPPRAERHPSLSEWVDGVGFLPLEVTVERGWSAFNPSLARLPDGSLRGVIRSSNYRMEHGRYVIDDGDAIRTANLLVDLGEDGTATNARSIAAPGRRVVTDFPVHGYEDVRLAPAGDELWALATVRDADAGGLCRVALLRLADDGRVVDEWFVEGPARGRHEKNWAPFADAYHGGDRGGDGLTVVYSWDPLIVASLSLDPATPDSERYRELSRRPSGLGASVRGGTNGVRIDGGWLFLVHVSRRFPDGGARYLHRFVTVRDDFGLGRVSPFLTLMTDGVEFALGAAIAREELLIGFGVDDAEAWVARVDLARVLERLVPLGSDEVSS